MGEKDTVRLDLPAQHKYLNVVGACIGEMLAHVEGIAEPDILAYNVQLAVHEACANIVDHAYDGYPNGGRIQITVSVCDAAPRRLLVELRDTGKAFDIATVSEPALGEPQERGLGLFLMRQLLDEVGYFPQTGGNCWRLVKLL